MKPTITLSASIFLLNLILSSCSSPALTATQTQSGPATETRSPSETLAPTPTASPEPSATATPTLLDLETLEWSEFPYAHLADPSNTDTHVEVLLRNPNEAPVRVLQDRVELRFLGASGQVVYANPNPFFYLWQGSWMLPGETAALSACVCFETSGVERQAWESLELVAPLEIATDLAYTLDVEVTVGEFLPLVGGSSLGARTTLTNTSEYVLESIPMLVFARDLSGRYIGMAIHGNAVVSFFEDIGIEPGATGTGISVSDIDYFHAPMTYEVRALGILAPPAESAPAGTPVTDWQGIPIMPGALRGGEADDGYQFSTQATIHAITQFYETAFTDLGYALAMSGEHMGNTFLVFEKDSMTAIIGISPSAELNLVQITVL